MSFYSPFAFVKQETGGGAPVVFDPTAGGTLTPYWWFDFTDSSTMTLVSTDRVTAIQSKGSNTSSITNSNATTNPTFKGNYTEFLGTLSTNQRLRIDTNFPINRLTNSWTLVHIGNFKFPAGAYTFNGRFSSYIDSNNTVANACQWDIFPGPSSIGGTGVDIDTGAGSPPSGFPVIYGGFYSGQDNYNWKTFTSATETGFTSINYRYDHTDLKSDLGIALGSSNMTQISNNNMATYTNGNGIGFTIGGRAYSNLTAGATMDVSHVLFYSSALTDGELDTILGTYTAPY